jgi:hypothetical protein
VSNDSSVGPSHQQAVAQSEKASRADCGATIALATTQRPDVSAKALQAHDRFDEVAD